MPCMKCANGKYKYGERGRCQFDTLKACKEAAAAIHAKPKACGTCNRINALVDQWLDRLAFIQKKRDRNPSRVPHLRD